MTVIQRSIRPLLILALFYGQTANICGATLCSPPCLLVANTSDIVALDYKTAALSAVVSGLTRAVAIDVHFSLGYIFWSDVTEKNIKRFRIDVASTTTIITGIGVCDGLTVDWRASQLYWTDRTSDTISVSDLDGNNQGLLISSGLDEPRGIALDLDNSLMFWTDWGVNEKIERASLNGGNRVAIVTTYLYYPNGIELDTGNKRIFWVDAGYDRVESVDYNGNNRKLLYQLSGLHPFGLTLIPPFLFFTDWVTAEQIHQLDATTGRVVRKFSVNGGQPMGIVTYDASRQPAASNPCTVNNGGCSHFCVTKSSGYECVCPTGLAVKQDGKTCEDKVTKFILFADADDKSTKFVSLDTTSSVSQTLFHHLGTQRPIALDYDPVEERVYWSDIAQGLIISAFFNATSVKTLFRCNVRTPDGVAIDHVGRNIYWTDTGTNRIEVGKLDGTGRKLLIKGGLDEPRAIVLDEKNGIMYWTDWGSNPKIEKAEMDGSARRIIVTGNLVWPNGLTIHQETNRLFWADAKLDKIEVSDLNGANRQLIMSSVADIHPYGLAVYHDMLYWTDWNAKSISKYNLTSGNKDTLVDGLQKPMDIHIFDPALMFFGSHNCSQNNGLCSDFCLLKPGGYQCACPTGIALKSDGKTCDHVMFDKTSSDKFVIFADTVTGEIYKAPLEVPETPCYPVEISTNISSPVAVDYDPVEGKIYWSDVTLELVARAFPNGSSVYVIAYNNVINPEGLAVDYIGRNIYWTDQANNRIEVAKMDGSSRRSLITSNIEKPRAILLDIGERKMYWGGRGISLKIEQANMDGSGRTTLVSSGLTWVNSLAMDYQSRLLYWCDGYHDRIERVDLQGNNRVVILDLSLDSMHPFGLALFGEAIFWSDRNSQSIHKYNMTTSVKEVVVHGMGLPMELHVYDQSKLFTGSTSCSQLNGGCSHLCLPNPSGHQCFCPEGVQLKPGDAFTCEGVNSCPRLTAPAHGSLAPCNNFPGHICHFSCDIGYTLTGSATRTCASNGVWTGTQPQCNAIRCPSLSTPTSGVKTGCTDTAREPYNTQCSFSCNVGYNLIGSSVRRCLENGTWSGETSYCRDKPTTTTSTTTTVVPTTLVKNVRITEGDDFTLNCTTEINTHEWSREEGKPDISEERTLKDGESISSSATVKDSGKYLCEIDNERYIFNVSVKVLVKVEMVISVLSYTFTPELQNKSSQVYKETEKNFTAEMDKVYNNTPGYVRTEVLNFTEGSVKVDFRVIIVFVATDPKNESTIIDKKATTGQTIIKEAENGLVSRLRVKPEVTVKTPPPEPRGVGFYDVKPDQIGIQWMVPDGFKSFDILSYEVEHWIFGKMDKRRKKLPAPEAKTEYSYRIQDLEPETTYMIRVAAINVHGSNYNEEKGQKTPPAPFPYWVIALIVLFAVAAIIGAVVCIRRRMIQRRNQQHEEEALGVMESPKKFESVLNQDEKIKGLNLKFTNASYRPTDVDWTEIPFESIKIMDELGSGAFGVVYKGEICRENGNIMPCAVKALKASATDEEIRDLYNELEIMSNIGSHPNLVNLLGACTKDGNLLVVLEIAENGSLIEFLKKIRSKNENYEGEGAVVRSGLSTDMKLSIALDVAKGMAHLASHRCIHRDLAARNVLLGKNYVAKVADYGMARDVYEQLMYKKETQGKLPVKWMAIESLETYVFTVESDVWSYGVLLWEMETGGLKPYPGLTTTELMAELKKGYRLEQPNGCSNEMYQVMMDCWHSNPSLRPTFDQLVERLEKMSVSS